MAVAEVLPWEELAAEVSEAKRLVRSDTLDPVELASANYPVLRRVGPSFLAAFTFRAAPAFGALVRAVEIVRDLHAGRRRKLPAEAPTSFVRQGWRRQLLPSSG